MQVGNCPRAHTEQLQDLAISHPYAAAWAPAPPAESPTVQCPPAPPSGPPQGRVSSTHSRLKFRPWFIRTQGPTSLVPAWL